ncbi:uncharacterized protein [Pyxicephalus adspersus]|uniref:uncharacterized protein n=1 Tax=Pyxicephalus adspersus TaxID=30357 RepID=UPI003B597AB4
MDSSDNKAAIFNFSLPQGQAYTRVLLQLFGYAGHGKSAFVNSCIYTLGNETFRIYARTGSSGTIITLKRNSYNLTDTITIVDNRGFGKKEDAEEAVVYAQLGNFLPLNQDVMPTDDFFKIMSQVEASDLEPNYSDFIVPIFVYSVKLSMPEHQVQEIQRFFRNCKNMTGVVPIVVLTHKSHRSYRDLEEKFRRAGAEAVMAIENYTPEDNMKTRGRCTDIQNVILHALNDVKFHLKERRNPIKERVERKKLVLNFAFEAAVKKIKDATAEKAKNDEYQRLKCLADKSWIGKFPYGQ